MKQGFLPLALLSVLLAAGSQIALKAGMTSPRVQAAIATSGAVNIFTAVCKSSLILVGLFGFGLSALVWLAVLSKVPLSAAYPLVALGIAVTTVAGLVLFNESISAMKVVGVALIICGVFAIAASQ